MREKSDKKNSEQKKRLGVINTIEEGKISPNGVYQLKQMLLVCGVVGE